VTAPRTSDRVPLLEARRLRKQFGHVQALDSVDFTVYPGEICALVGDNGAGKSTLVKILAGAQMPDSGDILIDGQRVEISSPPRAQELGIETVYQDLALAPELTPTANLFLGREILRSGVLGKFGVLDRKTMNAQAMEAFAALGVRLRSSKIPVASLSGGQRQSVAIARAATWARKLVMLDEPTAALGVVQTQRVVDLVRRVRDNGTTVVLISHNMQQVLEVADRVEVLRLGQRVARLDTSTTSVEELVTAMTTGGVRGEAA
jgi:simple sugar transport system ATP-binding protein